MISQKHSLTKSISLRPDVSDVDPRVPDKWTRSNTEVPGVDPGVPGVLL